MLASSLDNTADHRNIPKYKEIVSYGLTSIIQITEVEKSLESLEGWYNNILTWKADRNSSISVQLPRPVYVEKDDAEKERIIYKSSAMELGKLYEIEYKGERWALRRNEREVEFMKFHPNKK